jgi:hypothetical protein
MPCMSLANDDPVDLSTVAPLNQARQYLVNSIIPLN